MTKVAVILSGCGVFDGCEVHESTFVLLALDQAGVEYECLAPNINQMHVINHLTGQEEDTQRNVLVESARIARGKVLDLVDAVPGDYSAVIVPGGFGVAKNLCDFALKGAGMSVNEQVQIFIQAIHNAGHPVGLACISPVMSKNLFGDGVLCTIGNDEETAAAIVEMGATHQNCAVDDIVIDEKNKLVTTPAYMLADRIKDVHTGITKMVVAVLEMLK